MMKVSVNLGNGVGLLLPVSFSLYLLLQWIVRVVVKEVSHGRCETS